MSTKCKSVLKYCLNLCDMSFPKFVNMTKNIPFFPILHVFASLSDVRAYTVWSWKITLILWIFFMRMISNFKYKWPPPPRWSYAMQSFNQAKWVWSQAFYIFSFLHDCIWHFNAIFSGKHQENWLVPEIQAIEGLRKQRFFFSCLVISQY